jgi:hypothetical protein
MADRMDRKMDRMMVAHLELSMVDVTVLSKDS